MSTPPPAVELTVDPVTGALRLRVNGPLTPGTLDAAQAALLQALETHPDKPIVLDLGPLPPSDAATLQLLLASAETLRSRGQGG